MEIRTTPDSAKRLDRAIAVLFWIQAVIGALWAYQDPLPPLQDYPNHVANVFIMLKLSASAFFQHYYSLDFFPFPYMLQDPILALLMKAGGVDFAAKSFVFLIMLSIPAGMFFFFRKTAPDKIYLCYFSLPLIWNKPLFKGNCNFILGLALAYASLGILWTLLHSERNRKALALFLSTALLVYLTHLIVFYIYLFSVLFFVGYTAIQEKDKTRAYLLFALIPVFLMMVLNMVRSPSTYPIGLLIGKIFSSETFTGKFGEIGSLLACFSGEEIRILAPYWGGLGLLILLSLSRFRAQPFPFIYCASLFVLYLITPRQVLFMIRPYERLLFFLLFLLPLCCINRKHLMVEKIAVVLICTFSFVRAEDYFSKVSTRLNPSMAEARALLNELPERKRLMTVWAQWPGMGSIGYAYCVQAYYTMDREGYVSSLYTGQFTFVKHKNALAYSPHPREITREMVLPYDFLFVWGREPGVEAFLMNSGFKPWREKPAMAVYINTSTPSP